jgi:NADPH:quinone reductase
VTGAAGSVGSAAIQIARWRGARQVQALVRDDDEVQQAARWGASLATPDAGQLARRAKGERATVCLDTVGGPVLDAAMAAMDDEGRLVNITSPGDGTVTFSLRRFCRASLTLRGLNTTIYDVIDGARTLDALADGFAAGALRPPPIGATFPLSRAREAYALAPTRPAGKVVLDSRQPR